MSLFDVIRYPINESFLEEDLARIPSIILNDWWKEFIEHKKKMMPGYTGVWMSHHISSPKNMSRYMRMTGEQWYHEYALKDLQRRLKEYD
jgi:hypothetical protein